MSSVSVTYSFPLNPDLATFVYHPSVVTSFFAGTQSASLTTQTYARAIEFNPSLSTSEVRLTNDGNGNMVIDILDGTSVIDTFTLRDFEDGRSITGIPQFTNLDGTLALGGDEGSSFTQTPTGDFQVGIDATGSGFQIFNATATVTYFLESVTIAGIEYSTLEGVPIFGGDQGDTLLGFDVNDFTGKAYNDFLQGRGGIDTLIGAAGNDTLDGGIDRDLVRGGEGDDVYILRPGDGSSAPAGFSKGEVFSESPGEGIDTLKIEGVAPEDLRIVDFSSGVIKYYSLGLPDADGNYKWTQIEIGRDQSPEGVNFWDRFERVEFDDGTVWTVDTGLKMRGTEDSETITGTPEDDLIAGNGSNDRLNGGDGNDTLDGGTGLDSMAGGEGDDVYVLRGGDGGDAPSTGRSTNSGDSITEQPDQGNDTLKLEGVNPEDLRIVETASGVARGFAFGLPDENGDYTWTTVELGNVTGTAGNPFWDRFERVEFDDGTVWTVDTGLKMRGTEDSETITGTPEDDLIAGNGGNDTLRGVDGNDTLDGGTGLDSMTGGEGDDVYILRGGDGGDAPSRAFSTNTGDSITEQPDQGNDTLKLEGVNPEDLRIVETASGVARGFAFGLPDENGDYTWTTVELGNVAGTAGNPFWDRFERVEFDDGTVWTAQFGPGILGSEVDTIDGEPVENTAPVANEDAATTEEGSAVVINVLGNDTDADGDSLVLAGITQPGSGQVTENPDGTVTYTPDEFATGLDFFSYFVSDQQGGIDEGEVSVSVTPKGPQPLPNNVVDVASASNDFNILVQALELVDLRDTLQLAEDITVFAPTDAAFTQFAVDFGYEGDQSDEGEVFDYFVEVLAEVTLGDPLPLLKNVLLYHVSPGAKTAEQIAIADKVETLLPGESLAPNGATLVDAAPDLVDPKITLPNVSASNGTIQGIDRVLLPLDVAAVEDPNIAPVANDDTATTTEDSAEVIDLTGNDTDADGGTLSLVSFTQPNSGTVTDNNDGTVTYTPNPGFTGTDAFTYVVSDGQGGTDSGAVTVTVEADDPPIEDPELDGLVLTGTEGRDTLMGQDGDDTITGGPDRDKITGGEGDDSIEGGDGNDKVSGGAGDNMLFGGDGDDAVRDKSGSSLLDGGEGDDRLKAGNGADTLIGGEGDDTMKGGKGEDVFQFGPDDGEDVITDFKVGQDLLVFEGITFGDGEGEIDPEDFLFEAAEIEGRDLVISLSENSSVRLQDVLEDGDTETTVLDFLPALVEVPAVEGTANADELIGNHFNNEIFGGDGDDDILGLGGKDTLFGGDGNDSIDGGDGDDRLNGGGGDNTLLGGEGNDRIGDKSGDSLLNGGDGNDRLGGGNGEDTLVGGLGDDRLTGGKAADLFRIGTDDTGSDEIIDFKLGEDRLELSDFAFFENPDVEAGRMGAQELLAQSAQIQDGEDLFLNLGDGRAIKLLGVVDEDAVGDEVEDYVDIFFT